MTSSSWEQSKCKGIWLHRYKIEDQYVNAIKERCEICGKPEMFKVDLEGRPNNLQYIASHIRQVLIPQHNLYSHEYPNK